MFTLFLLTSIKFTLCKKFDLYEKARYESTVMELYREVLDIDDSYERPTIEVDQSFLDLGEIRCAPRGNSGLTLTT
jgi:hypothetical protein